MKMEAGPGLKTGGFWNTGKYKFAMLAPALTVLCLLTVVPILITFWMSLTSFYLASSGPMKFIGLKNYLTILEDAKFINSLRITAVYTVFTLSIEIVLGVAVALILNTDFSGKGMFRTLFLIPMLSTPVAISQVWKNIFEPNIGILNYFFETLGLERYAWVYDSSTVLPSLILVDVWKWTPLIAIIVLAGLTSLPSEPYESARVDGVEGSKEKC